MIYKYYFVILLNHMLGKRVMMVFWIEFQTEVHYCIIVITYKNLIYIFKGLWSRSRRQIISFYNHLSLSSSYCRINSKMWSLLDDMAVSNGTSYWNSSTNGEITIRAISKFGQQYFIT